MEYRGDSSYLLFFQHVVVLFYICILPRWKGLKCFIPSIILFVSPDPQTQNQFSGQRRHRTDTEEFLSAAYYTLETIKISILPLMSENRWNKRFQLTHKHFVKLWCFMIDLLYLILRLRSNEPTKRSLNLKTHRKEGLRTSSLLRVYNLKWYW